MPTLNSSSIYTDATSYSFNGVAEALRYVSASDISLSLKTDGGDIFIDQAYDFQYTYREMKEPIYGYRDSEFSTVLRGTKIVYGQFAINYIHDGYLNTLLHAKKVLQRQPNIYDAYSSKNITDISTSTYASNLSKWASVNSKIKDLQELLSGLKDDLSQFESEFSGVSSQLIKDPQNKTLLSRLDTIKAGASKVNDQIKKANDDIAEQQQEKEAIGLELSAPSNANNKFLMMSPSKGLSNAAASDWFDAAAMGDQTIGPKAKKIITTERAEDYSYFSMKLYSQDKEHIQFNRCTLTGHSLATSTAYGGEPIKEIYSFLARSMNTIL